MKNYLLIFVIFLITNQLMAQNEAKKDLTIGEVRTIQSTSLNEERILNIQLPQTYDTTKTYPVLYLLDGSMHEDFLHIVGLFQFFNLQFQTDEFIIVGISNIDRKRDFTFPTEIEEDKKNFPTTGHSAAFIDFLEKELQPFMEKNYRTSDTKYIIGQSLGGLLATEILLKKPELFTHYLIVSPSLWWNDQSLLAEAPALLAKQNELETYVYISVGKGEHRIMRKDAKALAKVLNKANQPKMKIDFLLMKDEDHATILHNSIYQGLLKILKK